MITRAEYEQKIKEHIDNNMPKILSDKWRSKYHIMAPIGWINDPNGLCQFNDEYHVFYQYSPLEAKGGMKFWGHFVSKDLVHFQERDIAIYPDVKEDKDGVYSGSAFVKDDTMYFFYTGNVKHDGEHDYILTGREQNVILVTSKDGIEFSEKKILLRNSDFPENMSLHVRDPKVWEEDGTYYMVLGARGKDDKGYVLLYKSSDLYNWTLHSVPAGGEENMGYMWECPDLFYVDGKTVFMFSPQGLKADGFKYNNVYQSGYAFGNFVNDKKELKLGNFVELDRGFDFYAPQTFEDTKGRRIMIGWMGVPDAIEHKNPTVENYWQHQLTLPKELNEDILVGGISIYNDASMTVRKELFNRKTVKRITIPFETETYLRYLNGLVICDVSLKGYSKKILQSLKQLATSVYSTSNSSNGGKYTPPSVKNTTFSSSMNSTLEQMSKRY